MVTRNVGTIDRYRRLAAGSLLLMFALFSGMAMFDVTAMMVGSVVVGAILIGTALFNFCPLYRVFGFRTCNVE